MRPSSLTSSFFAYSLGGHGTGFQSLLTRRRCWIHDQNSPLKISDLKRDTQNNAWHLFLKKRPPPLIKCHSCLASFSQKPRSWADFIFPNRLARSALLVGSWVHFDGGRVGSQPLRLLGSRDHLTQVSSVISCQPVVGDTSHSSARLRSKISP